MLRGPTTRADQVFAATARLLLFQLCGPVQQDCSGYGRCCSSIDKEAFAVGTDVPTENL